jgi:hypothetical protein
MNSLNGFSELYLAVPVAVLFGSFIVRNFKISLSSLGIFKLGYLALLGAALFVAGLLVLNPEPLARNFPGWKGSAGLVLLAASCIGVSKALWGMIRATVLVGVWGAVSLVLASSIFLDKLPQNISRGDLAKLQGAISSELVLEKIEQLQGISWPGGGAGRRSSPAGYLKQL